MKNFLKCFFARKSEPISPDQVDDPDQAMREMVSAAFNSNGLVIGNVKDGKLVIDHSDGTQEVRDLK